MSRIQVSPFVNFQGRAREAMLAKQPWGAEAGNWTVTINQA